MVCTLAFVLGDNRAVFRAAIMASSIKDDTDIYQLPAKCGGDRRDEVPIG